MTGMNATCAFCVPFLASHDFCKKKTQYFPMFCDTLAIFVGDLQAVVKDVALSLPHFLDFGLCPTMERP